MSSKYITSVGVRPGSMQVMPAFHAPMVDHTYQLDSYMVGEKANHRIFWADSGTDLAGIFSANLNGENYKMVTDIPFGEHCEFTVSPPIYSVHHFVGHSVSR